MHLQNRNCGVFLLMALGAAALVSCGTTQPQRFEGPAALASRPAEKPGEQTEWESLLAAGRKERTVTIYGNTRPQTKQEIAAIFKEKFDVDVEWLVGRAEELVAKIKAERNAGIYSVDIGFFGSSPFIPDIRPAGITMPLEPMLVLPEVKDPRNWSGGQLPFLDKEKTAFRLVRFAIPFYHRNTELVRPGEITTSTDLLNPKWAGKIVISDPSISGNGNSWFTWMLTGVLGKEKGVAFMKELVSQKPMVTRDERQLTEWVARGKYYIGVAPSTSLPAEFMQLGAPVDFVDVAEPRCTGSGFGIVMRFKAAPHPNAAGLFINWLLSKEGSSIFARTTAYASSRLDVAPEGILPILVPRSGDVDPDVKYDDYIAMKGEMRKVAADIFGGSTK